VTLKNQRTWLPWRWGALASLAVALLSLYPQFNLLRTQGRDYHGSYAYIDTDEVAYSAYLNALIEGRPRRNDPYTGRDDSANTPQSESLFSIQFVPPYILALFARGTGLSATTIFILLLPLMAFASALVIFRLVALITNDERWGAVAPLIVLLFGTLAAGHGAIQYYLQGGAAYDYFPFLRRYLPGIIFPLYFIMCLFVWRMLTSDDRRKSLRLAVAAGITFDILVFSYFYLWTAAAAWLALLAICWMLMRTAEWRHSLKLFGVIGALAIAALAPYTLLLSRRVETMDAVQALSLSHAPDLWRIPELIGFCVLLFLYLAISGKWIERDAPATIFTASFALLPLAVFNQQIITGRSLQPIHYEQFIANYVSLLAVTLLAALLWHGLHRAERKLPLLLACCISLFALSWGALETRMALKIMAPLNSLRDEVRPVELRLAEIARKDESERDAKRIVVFTADSRLADDLPTHTPFSVLWARHMHVFAGVSLAEDKERFYQYLYYTGVDEGHFARRLEQRDFNYLLALFGWTRTNPNLRLDPDPVRPEELDEELQRYTAYLSGFNRERATRPTLSFVIVSPREPANLNNIDRWYERDAGERIGNSTLYRVRLRP
jgi:hypothetical protein